MKQPRILVSDVAKALKLRAVAFLFGVVSRQSARQLFKPSLLERFFARISYFESCISLLPQDSPEFKEWFEHAR